MTQRFGTRSASKQDSSFFKASTESNQVLTERFVRRGEQMEMIKLIDRSIEE